MAWLLFQARKLPLEPLIWTAGLLYLGLIDPDVSGALSFCLAKVVGFGSCPGCGLGASISHALHGDFARSWSAHPLGIIALIVLVRRILFLIYPTFLSTHQPKG